MGEIEVGKELVANASQRGSWRHDGFYVKVNCGFIHYTLIDSDPLGMKGPFTGAFRLRKGKFELTGCLLTITIS